MTKRPERNFVCFICGVLFVCFSCVFCLWSGYLSLFLQPDLKVYSL